MPMPGTPDRFIEAVWDAGAVHSIIQVDDASRLGLIPLGKKENFNENDFLLEKYKRNTH